MPIALGVGKVGLGVLKKIGKSSLKKLAKGIHSISPEHKKRRRKAVLTSRDLKGARRLERVLKRFGMRPKTRMSARKRRF